MRPLLGTFVEVAVDGLPPPRAARAIERAFAAVQRVHTLMSFHDATSDVSRLNRNAARRPVKVHPWTYRVLSTAQRIAALSDGRFDIAIAPRLVGWGLLPRPPAWQGDAYRGADWRQIALRPGHRVRFLRPLAIDLGGIAKGFAVDRAVEALRRAGARGGVVNAGGDLRVFGPRSRVVHVRHPDAPTFTVRLGRIREGAVASSSPSFALRRWRGRDVNPLVDARTGRPAPRDVGVTVLARTCMIADALTKVVLSAPESAGPVLRRWRARARVACGRPTQGGRPNA